MNMGDNFTYPLTCCPIGNIFTKNWNDLPLDSLQSAATIKANLIIEHVEYPSVNIVAKLKGTDPILSSEYLLYSGHQDAHGVRNAINNDSIYYGADDNASVDVAMLANARAFKKTPDRKSVV